MIEIHTGNTKDKSYISYRLEKLGRDWVLYITGGVPHIGSVTCTEKTGGTGETHQFTLRHHREDIIVRMALERLKRLLEGEILVVGGIHYDGIEPDQIRQIEQNCASLLERLTAKLIDN